MEINNIMMVVMVVMVMVVVMVVMVVVMVVIDPNLINTHPELYISPSSHLYM